MRIIAAAIVAGSLILSTVVLATVALAQSTSTPAPAGSTAATPPAAAAPAVPAAAAAPPSGKKLACQSRIRGDEGAGAEGSDAALHDAGAARLPQAGDRSEYRRAAAQGFRQELRRVTVLIESEPPLSLSVFLTRTGIHFARKRYAAGAACATSASISAIRLRHAASISGDQSSPRISRRVRAMMPKKAMNRSRGVP